MPLASITGFLYFPGAGSCNDTNAIPESAREFVSLPNRVPRIAVLPNTVCLDDYLIQAGRDQAIAAIIYDYSTASETLVMSGTYSQPLFGISSDEGNQLLDNVRKYSQNVSSIPNGESLSAIFNPAALGRLDVTITPPPPKSSLNLPMIIGISGGVVVALLVGFIIGWKLSVRWNRGSGRKPSLAITL